MVSISVDMDVQEYLDVLNNGIKLHRKFENIIVDSFTKKIDMELMLLSKGNVKK